MRSIEHLLVRTPRNDPPLQVALKYVGQSLCDVLRVDVMWNATGCFSLCVADCTRHVRYLSKHPASSGKRQISQRQKQEQQREGNDDDLDDEEEDDGDYEVGNHTQLSSLCDLPFAGQPSINPFGTGVFKCYF